MLELLRDTFTKTSTIGELYGDGEFLCDTLEDPVREGPKIFSLTAIPTGSYEILMEESPHFKRLMPHLQNVPDFTNIMIHIANWATDVKGCIGVGERNPHVVDFVGNSKDTFEDLVLPWIKKALEKGKLFIEIRNARAI